MSIQLRNRIFGDFTKFQAWAASTRASFRGASLPRILSVSDSTDGYRVIYEDSVVMPGERSAFAARGLSGVEIAAGVSPAGTPILSYAEQLIVVGQSVPEVVVAEVQDVTNGILDTFAVVLNRGMPVPGTLAVRAPSVGDVTETPSVPPLLPAEPVDGGLAGDDLASGSVDYWARTLKLVYATPPAAGNITVDYTADPFPGSVDMAPGVRLVRLEIHYLSGTGTPDFTWNIYEDSGGNVRVPGATGTTGAMSAGDVYTVDIDKISVIHSLLASEQGKRWVGLEADVADDHQAAVLLLFSAEE